MEPRPGWFPDVTQPDRKRWWDGARWTDHRRPIADPDDGPPPPPRAPTTDRTTDGWEAQQMPGGGPMPRRRTSGRAIASIAFGTVWLFGVGSLAGIVLAVAAFREVGRSSGQVGGKVVAALGLLVSLFTLSLTLLLVVRFDEVVDTVKVDVVEAATRRELRDAAAAMEAHHTSTGAFPDDVDDLRTYEPAADLTLVVARASVTTFCLEALHRDGDTVWHLQRGEAPALGRC